MQHCLISKAAQATRTNWTIYVILTLYLFVALNQRHLDKSALMLDLAAWPQDATMALDSSDPRESQFFEVPSITFASCILRH